MIKTYVLLMYTEIERFIHEKLLFGFWPLWKAFQWNLNRNTIIVIQANAFQIAVYEIMAILSWTQCVNLPQDYARLTKYHSKATIRTWSLILYLSNYMQIIAYYVYKE